MNAPLAKEQIALLMSDSLTYRSAVVQGTDGTVADAPPSILHKTFRAVADVVASVRAMSQRRAVLNELSTLNDRELADIGLSRSELGNVFDPKFAAARRSFA